MKNLETRQAAALALVRIVVGVVFLAHGWQKLFVFGHAGVTGAMTQLGIPFPALSAYLVSFTEFFGGLALLFGLLTRLAAIPIAFTMLVAMTQVHAKGGFFLPNGIEYTLTLLISSIGFALAGSGAFALDNLIFKSTPRSELRRAEA